VTPPASAIAVRAAQVGRGPGITRAADGQWALVLLALGFLMPGVNKLAHAGGFAGGYVTGLALGHEERRPEPRTLPVAAAATVLLTAACFALAIWTAIAR
jgi:hypothetical protein